MTGYIVFAIVVVTCIIVFALLWRNRRSERARALGDIIKDQPSAHEQDLLDIWQDNH
ncbi:hypothetical protein Q4E93_26590 [Flavitalea sp. BT771]|uniref:hypothetical protein n=1 Tax=Flavitalea sp. BT771 TaxID=3063329 RepID=UPI0026E200E3|nr:hypothetical protein [Flavitalea sp. BT771]MDO6434206.1 hypothetical protein [Flavitalea sp. BT771]MDV6223106.1 hypothetical protein [Flavitalea sp. BT771]